ncbi:MAG: phenylacetate-CoA oxygenase subunit PaaJ [Bacteroidia bacterium]|nr:phenylacetate-CoA oxygenase subunit PaaJ [Bacteroidia bacterium]
MSVKDKIWKLLEEIPDPEIPVLSIHDLGIVRKIDEIKDEIIVTITPTYSGCPAMNRFEADIVTTLNKYGYARVSIETTYDPPWTTDWLSEEAKKKLQDYGIAPPEQKTTDKAALLVDDRKSVTCPQCRSTNSKMISQFGSTACKSLYQCNECMEPFDYFKCI